MWVNIMGRRMGYLEGGVKGPYVVLVLTHLTRRKNTVSSYCYVAAPIERLNGMGGGGGKENCYGRGDLNTIWT